MTQRVLVVDDEPLIRLLLRDALEDEGYDVRTAVNGVEALSLVEQEPPDLLILDLNMPELDGHGVVRGLEERGLKLFPILVFTGTTDRAIAPSVDGVALKTTELETLLGMVKRLLGVPVQ